MSGTSEKLKMDLSIPIPSEREAEIICRTLSVDAEPKRGGVSRIIKQHGSTVTVHFEALEARMLRVSVNNFFDHLNLVLQTIEQFGPPLSNT